MSEAPPELQLTLYPDPVLRKKARPIEVFDEELRRLAQGMLARMRASKGVGLAAPQVGRRVRLLVWNTTGEAGSDRILVNPQLVERSGPMTTYEEGCLSFPGIYAEVRRPDVCRVRFQDLDGGEHEERFCGFESRVVQHEYDHLEGVLLVDRMSPADKLRNKAALEELVENYRRRPAAGTGA